MASVGGERLLVGSTNFEGALSIDAVSGYPSYAVRVGKNVALREAPSLYTLARLHGERSLLGAKNSKSDNDKGGNPALGAFTGTSIEWVAAGSVPVITAVKNFPTSSAVLFETTFPDGANETACEDVDASSIIFPAFEKNAFSSALSWEGSFTQSVRGFSKGRRGGPTFMVQGKQSLS